MLNHSIVSNSLWPHGIFQARNTGVGCHFFLQGIFPVQGLNPSTSPVSSALAGEFFTHWAIWEVGRGEIRDKPSFFEKEWSLFQSARRAIGILRDPNPSYSRTKFLFFSVLLLKRKLQNFLNVNKIINSYSYKWQRDIGYGKWRQNICSCDTD